MVDPDKLLKEKLKEDRKREKLRLKLEKKLQSGKIDKVTYAEELHKLGFMTHTEIIEDFRDFLREEIERLEGMDANGGNGETTMEDDHDVPPGEATTMKELYGDELYQDYLPPPPPPKDYYTSKDAKEDFSPKAVQHGAPPVVDDDLEELDEDMADWDLDENDENGLYDDDDDDDDDFENKNDEPGDRPFVDVIKVDSRSGVVDYNEINEMDFSRVKVMDSYEHATELGARKKKRKKRRKERPREPEPEIVEEPMSEAERLIFELDDDSDDGLDLGEVFIPDVESTLKSKSANGASDYGGAEILWEADEEDEAWLQKRLVEETDVLKYSRAVWRVLRSELNDEAKAAAFSRAGKDVEEWALVKLMPEVVLKKVHGKLKKHKREIWKVKIAGTSDKKRRKAKEEKTKEKKKRKDNTKGKAKISKADEPEIEWD